MLESIPALNVLLEAFRPGLTAATDQSFCLLLAGSVLAQGCRTVTERLRVTAFLGPQKHVSSPDLTADIEDPFPRLRN